MKLEKSNVAARVHSSPGDAAGSAFKSGLLYLILMSTNSKLKLIMCKLDEHGTLTSPISDLCLYSRGFFVSHL